MGVLYHKRNTVDDLSLYEQTMIRATVSISDDTLSEISDRERGRALIYVWHLSLFLSLHLTKNRKDKNIQIVITFSN